MTSPPDSEPRQGPCHSVSGRRRTEATEANAVSSRSHAVLQVSVERSERTANVVVQMQEGKLKMVDLAGSERAQRTENTGIRLLEGANINRSLLALANCINALNKKTGKGAHVPYRDSKMTRMLKAHPTPPPPPPHPSHRIAALSFRLCSQWHSMGNVRPRPKLGSKKGARK